MCIMKEQIDDQDGASMPTLSKTPPSFCYYEAAKIIPTLHLNFHVAYLKLDWGIGWGKIPPPLTKS
jgi:hypothetical protein